MRGEVELDDAEIRGARLFVGKAACSDCHNTPLFSDNRYYNTGVPLERGHGDGEQEREHSPTDAQRG